MAAHVTMETLKEINKLGLGAEVAAMAYCKSLFDLVADPTDWKGPINKFIDSWRLDCSLEVLSYAIRAHTGNDDLQIDVVANTIHVRTAGYRAGPCGP